MSPLYGLFETEHTKFRHYMNMPDKWIWMDSCAADWECFVDYPIHEKIIRHLRIFWPQLRYLWSENERTFGGNGGATFAGRPFIRCLRQLKTVEFAIGPDGTDLSPNFWNKFCDLLKAKMASHMEEFRSIKPSIAANCTILTVIVTQSPADPDFASPDKRSITVVSMIWFHLGRMQLNPWSRKKSTRRLLWLVRWGEGGVGGIVGAAHSMRSKRAARITAQI